jgi:hypothetical protein
MSEVQKAIASVVELETRLRGALTGAGQGTGVGALSRTHCDAARMQVIAARHLMYANVYFELERRIAQVEMWLDARGHTHPHPEGD